MPRPEDPGRPSGFLRDRILCLGFRGVKHVAICIRITRLYQTSGQYGCPCGLCDSLCTLRKGCSMKENSMSVPPATLATGGSLRLTRRGLAPRKMHQASLGALTPAITWLWAAPHDGQRPLTNHQNDRREAYAEIGDSGPKPRALLCSVFTFFQDQFLLV